MLSLFRGDDDTGRPPAAQPQPLLIFIAPTPGGGTTVTRVWRRGAPRQCRLCPRGLCGAAPLGAHAVCLVVFDRRVEDSEAALVRFDGGETEA
jgi:hypothetical protein